MLRGRGDEIGQVAPQLVPFRRRAGPAHEQLQRDALRVGQQGAAQQLPEGLPPRLAAFARDQAEHETELVDDIALGRRDDHQLAVEHRLGLQRTAQCRQRGGIRAREVVTVARALEPLQVIAQAVQLRLVQLPVRKRACS